MSPKSSLTATNLSIYQHLSCDLYIYNIYNGQGTTATETSASDPSELSKAHFQRGLDWETCLYSWLDQSNLLLKVPHVPLEQATFRENLQFDDRDHFYVTGLSFWPPQRELDARFTTFRSEPLNFGLAKPDLLEIRRTETGFQWRVIDAKASKSVKVKTDPKPYCMSDCVPRHPITFRFTFTPFVSNTSSAIPSSSVTELEGCGCLLPTAFTPIHHLSKISSPYPYPFLHHLSTLLSFATSPRSSDYPEKRSNGTIIRFAMAANSSQNAAPKVLLKVASAQCRIYLSMKQER